MCSCREDGTESLLKCRCYRRTPHSSEVWVDSVVLVRFATVAIGESWFKARLKLRQLYEANLLPKLLFNDNLIKENRHFWRARSTAKAKKYEFVWVTGGKLFAKKEMKPRALFVWTVKRMLRKLNERVRNKHRMFPLNFQTLILSKPALAETAGQNFLWVILPFASCASIGMNLRLSQRMRLDSWTSLCHWN